MTFRDVISLFYTMKKIKNESLLRIMMISLSLIICHLALIPARAQNDTLTTEEDSLVSELRLQIQELKLQSILMQERLEDSGKSAREDSLRLAEGTHRLASQLPTRCKAHC